MTEPKIKKALLNKIFTIVKKEAEKPARGRWQQNSWRAFLPSAEAKFDDQRCKTALCFAGWAVELDDESDWIWSAKEIAKYAAEHDGEEPAGIEYVKANALEKKNGEAMKIVNPRGREVYGVEAGTRAERLLGLTNEEGEALFDGGNGLITIEKTIERIKTGYYR